MSDYTFNANCKIARDILAPLAVVGWTIHDADPRGENYGGAELQRESSDGEMSSVGLYVDTSEPRRVWRLVRWSGRNLAGVPESLDVSAPLLENGKPDADAVRDAARVFCDTTSGDSWVRMIAHLWLRVIDAHNAEARAVWSAQPSALRAKRAPVASGDDWAMRTASADDLLGWCDDLEARVGWNVADFRAALHDYLTARDGAADADMADYHAEVIARYATPVAPSVGAALADAEPCAVALHAGAGELIADAAAALHGRPVDVIRAAAVGMLAGVDAGTIAGIPPRFVDALRAALRVTA